MKFIEVTDRFDNKILVNFDRVEQVSRLEGEDFLRAEIKFVNENRNISLWVKESYDLIKQRIQNLQEYANVR